MKIFVSYSRKDAGDFAHQIQRYFTGFKYDIFTDTDNINLGDVWDTTIENNISSCDIFVVIVTYGALQSPHVENEVLQAQREKKKIIPCIHRTITDNSIKWGLNKIQGIEFDDKFELARNLYAKIIQNKGTGIINRGTDNSQIINNSSSTGTQSNRDAALDNTNNAKNRKTFSIADNQMTKKVMSLKMVMIFITGAAGLIITIAFLASANMLHLFPADKPVADGGIREAVNMPPIADAGVDQEVESGTLVTLNGGNSKDPEGEPLKYSWVQTTGSPVILGGKDKATATFTMPDTISADTIYTFKLVVTDKDGATGNDFVKVTAKHFTPILNSNMEPVNLLYSTAFIPEAVRLANLKSFTHSVTVWINSTVPGLSNIKNVTYFTKEGYTTLAGGQADSFSPADKFRISFNALDGFPLNARIYFKDGQMQNLSTNIVLR